MGKVQTGNLLHIGLNDKSRAAICKDLQSILADEFTLYAKTRSFHWNVEGPHFGSLHKLFEQQYEQLATIVDEVAERIRQLGQYVDGTMNGYLHATQLQEQSGEGISEMEMLHMLTDDHEAIIRLVRESIDSCEDQHDKGTADFLTNLMETHEKMAWMLRAHIH